MSEGFHKALGARTVHVIVLHPREARGRGQEAQEAQGKIRCFDGLSGRLGKSQKEGRGDQGT